MTWNETSQQWLPDVQVDEDFLAIYNANYGLQYDYSKMPVPKPEVQAADEADGQQQQGSSKEGEKKKLSKEEKMVRKNFITRSKSLKFRPLD